MDVSARFGLPLLAAGQSQKELAHNEAIQGLDLVAAAAVEEGPRASPPAYPSIGTTYIVAAGATGGWAGRDQCLAGYTAGGWRFVTPRPGLLAYVVSDNVWAVFRGGAWETGTVRGNRLLVGNQQVVGARGSSIAAPGGGSTVDAEARACLTSILAALRTHGLIAS